MPDWEPRRLLEPHRDMRHAVPFITTHNWDFFFYILQVILLLSCSFPPFETVSSCEELYQCKASARVIVH